MARATGMRGADAEAVKYLKKLLEDGPEEGICEEELKLPPWFDAKLFREGQQYIHKYRFFMSIGFLIGFIASLSIPSILKIITCTGQSDTHKKAYRRYMSTILHTMSWYTNPLEPGSRLWESVTSVRDAHFRTSKSCFQKQAGQITQKDLALTQFSLIAFFMLGADRMNLNDSDFLESTTYMWRVLGSLLGIKDEYNICTGSWTETKPRFEIVMERVFRPALLCVGPKFCETTRILLEGLQPLHMVLTFDSTMFYIKRMAGCEGYEFLEDDFQNGVRKSGEKLYYNSLGTWDRIVLSSNIVMFTRLYRYTIVRWYMNLLTWMGERLMYYFPVVAIFRYGWDWAYIRIFKTKEKRI